MAKTRIKLPATEFLEDYHRLQLSQVRFYWEGTPTPKPRMTRKDVWLDPPRPPVARWRHFKNSFYGLALSNRFQVYYMIAEIQLVAYIPFPRNWKADLRHKMAGQPHFQRTPDADNITKACLDALVGEDHTNWKQNCEKRWQRLDQLPGIQVLAYCYDRDNPYKQE